MLHHATNAQCCYAFEPVLESNAESSDSALLLVLGSHALSLTGNPALARLAESTLLAAVQQVGFLLRNVFWVVLHLRSNVTSSILKVCGTIDRRLLDWVKANVGWRLYCSFIDGSETLGVCTQRVGWWLGLAGSASLAGFEVGGVLCEIALTFGCKRRVGFGMYLRSHRRWVRLHLACNLLSSLLEVAGLADLGLHLC